MRVESLESERFEFKVLRLVLRTQYWYFNCEPGVKAHKANDISTSKVLAENPLCLKDSNILRKY